MKELTKSFFKFVERLEEEGLDLKAFKVLIVIAQNEGEGVLKLAEKGNITRSVFSRYVGVLSGGVPKVIPPAKALVRTKPIDHKTKALSLTDRGKALIKELAAYMD